MATVIALTAGAQTAIDQYDADPQSISRSKAVLQASPPLFADRAAQIKFHTERADAARRLGDTQQQVAELRKAHELAGGADPIVVDRLASAEHLLGNRDAATRLREEILQKSLSVIWRFFHTNTLAGYYVEIGDFKRASPAIESAEKLLTSLPTGLNRRNATSNFHWVRSRLLRAQGKFSDAEAAARLSLSEHASYRDGVGEGLTDQGRYFRGLAETHYAGTLMAQGKFPQAEWIVRETLERTISETTRDSAPTARVALRLAVVMQAQGRYGDALSLARSSLKILETRGASPAGYNIAGARLLVGQTMVLLGEFEPALVHFAERLRAFESDPSNRLSQGGGGSVYWGYALIRTGKAADAVEMLRANLKFLQSRSGPTNYGVLEARGFLAYALSRSGQLEEATREFASAVPGLLERRATLSTEAQADVSRAARLNWVLEGYMELLGSRASAGGSEASTAAAEAFRLADVARASTVQRAVLLSSSRAAIRDPALVALAREEQDLGNRQSALTEILQNLVSRPREQQSENIIRQMRAQTESMAAERQTIRQQIAARFPEYMQLIEPRPSSVEDVQKILRPDETLLATYTMHDRTFVWAIPPSGAVRFAQANLGAEELARVVRRLRSALDVPESTARAPPVFDTALANTIYEKILRPVEAWNSSRTLLIVPHGPLGQLPFALLPTDSLQYTPTKGDEQYREVPWLLRKIAVVQVPSVNAFTALRAAPPDDSPRKGFVGFGDPVFSKTQVADARARLPGALRSRNVSGAGDQSRTMTTADLRKLPGLPDTGEELREIAAILQADAADVYLGARASETNVKKLDLTNRRIIAFATHGLVPGDLNGLTQPALALSNPEVTGEADADGLLTMEEILGLKLSADWVVLSACNTAAADGAGSEAVSGLGRAFFYAGARSLLVSNWAVETVSARLLTTDLFRRQAKDPSLTRAEALRQTMLDLLDRGAAVDSSGKVIHSYAHPVFWAPFTLVGDGSAR